MREAHNVYNLIYKEVLGSDLEDLKSKVKFLTSKGQTVVKVTQDGTVNDVIVSEISQVGLKAIGVNLDKHFAVKIIIRNPNSSLVDPQDRSSLHNGGKATRNRSAPYFFRQDGNPVDIVDIYSNQHVFLLLNGPSTAKYDYELLQAPGVISMGVNNGTHLTRTNLWACVDGPDRFMPSIWLDPKILKFIPIGYMHKRVWDPVKKTYADETPADFPNVVGYRRNERFDAETFLTETTINWGNHGSLGGGRSVMLATLRILYLLGFTNVYLMGCDFNMDETSKYFFEENRDKVSIGNNMNSYRLMMQYFSELQPHFIRAGFNVYNLNSDSGLRVFPFMSYPEALRKASSKIIPALDHSTVGMYTNKG